MLNHGAAATSATVDRGGTDLLTGLRVEAGDTVKIEGCGVMLLREDVGTGTA